ncbi:MAG: RdgB/HAM1 family non-canonical purine NTP pyrophosphatase [Pyrinomonadaceae bacterium]
MPTANFFIGGRSVKINRMEILAATKNSGKVREIEELLGDLPITLRSLKDFKNVDEPEETGLNFVENAALKAKYYAARTGLRALADDSGLEVEALGGAPGIFSARYAGTGASDAERIKKLLSEINNTGDENRFARFVCAVAFADERGKIIHTAEGVCNGKIAFAARGATGFGYDPIFIPEGFSQTFGELSGFEKRQISHRARAVKKIISFLTRFYRGLI